MREPADVKPVPQTSDEIMRFGLQEIGTLATGDHREPRYEELLGIKEYAQRILEAAKNAPQQSSTWTASDPVWPPTGPN